MLSLALAATASFLIVALSAFRLAPTDRGTGGFDLLGTADLPLHYDLNTPEGREQLGFSDADSAQLAGAEIVGFRVRDGEDASCLNLYQTTQPRVLGAPPELAEASNFQWATATRSSGSLPLRGEGWGGGEQSRSPPLPSGERSRWIWPPQRRSRRRRQRPPDRPDGPRPQHRVLQPQALRPRRPAHDPRRRSTAPSRCKSSACSPTASCRATSIVSEANFLRLFPEVAGRRFFLIRRGAEAPPTDGAGVAARKRSSKTSASTPSTPASGSASCMAVQNTYLSTFQRLGALGLLLGAVGLAVVQLRSVLERRGELALMQAAGFRRRRLARMVLAENLVLLVGGLAIGCVAALAAVLPHALIEQVGAPWRTLAVLLAIVAVAGAAAAWLAARVALARPAHPRPPRRLAQPRRRAQPFADGCLQRSALRPHTAPTASAADRRPLAIIETDPPPAPESPPHAKPAARHRLVLRHDPRLGRLRADAAVGPGGDVRRRRARRAGGRSCASGSPTF